MKKLTPLEKAQRMKNRRTCLSCAEREEINGVSYCRESGKLLHPYLLDVEYPAICPHDIKKGGGERE